jgi:hypothetical protein
VCSSSLNASPSPSIELLSLNQRTHPVNLHRSKSSSLPSPRQRSLISPRPLYLTSDPDPSLVNLSIPIFDPLPDRSSHRIHTDSSPSPCVLPHLSSLDFSQRRLYRIHLASLSLAFSHHPPLELTLASANHTSRLSHFSSHRILVQLPGHVLPQSHVSRPESKTQLFCGKSKSAARWENHRLNDRKTQRDVNEHKHTHNDRRALTSLILPPSPSKTQASSPSPLSSCPTAASAL